MATATLDAPASVLHDVPWDLYMALRYLPRNHHLRMTYHDGTLILVSPEYLHDRNGRSLGQIVDELADAFDIEIAGTGSTTFRRKGHGDEKGDAKEPDEGFYIGANELLIRGKDTIDLDFDPPPDLAIEVDNKSDSSLTLPTYAGLLVPELWRYDAREKTLWFGHLVDGSYETIHRSFNLPMVTTDLVLFALSKAEGVGGTTWKRWLRQWARALPGAIG